MEDYRTAYFSRRETGGCREIVAFEMTLLVWLLGGVTDVACFKDKVSSLEVDIDDVYQVLLRMSSGALGGMLVGRRQPRRRKHPHAYRRERHDHLGCAEGIRRNLSRRYEAVGAVRPRCKHQ